MFHTKRGNRSRYPKTIPATVLPGSTGRLPTKFMSCHPMPRYCARAGNGPHRDRRTPRRNRTSQTQNTSPLRPTSDPPRRRRQGRPGREAAGRTDTGPPSRGSRPGSRAHRPRGGPSRNQPGEGRAATHPVAAWAIPRGIVEPRRTRTSTRGRNPRPDTGGRKPGPGTERNRARAGRTGSTPPPKGGRRVGSGAGRPPTGGPEPPGSRVPHTPPVDFSPEPPLQSLL